MRELDELKEADPEFYKFMEKEEKRLLKFGEEEVAEKADEKALADADPRSILSEKMLKDWEIKARAGSVKALKSLVDAFKVACHLNDDDEGDLEESLTYSFKIMNSGVFNQIMQFAMKEMIPLFESHLKKDSKTQQTGYDLVAHWLLFHG
jgi:nucleolar complex protein 2